MKRFLVVIVGATGSGKSAVAEALAPRIGAELVSADAFQVYRGLDIGTAKPDAATQARIRYHCVDVLDPDERSTAGDHARRARGAIDGILRRGRVPVLVGGTGFYVEATVHGLGTLPASDPRWREVLGGLLQRRGSSWMHGALRELDPARAAALDAADTHRVLRALEVVWRGGRPMTEQLQQGPGLTPLDIPVLWFGLVRPSAELAERIARRLQSMLSRGWLQEVQRLLDAGVSPRAHAMQAIGYRELAQVCRGEISLAQAEDSIAQATRQYAKRQRTWFGRYSQIEWIELRDGSTLATPDTLASRIRARIEAAQHATVSAHSSVSATFRGTHS